MAFYWSYALLLEPPVLLCSCIGNSTDLIRLMQKLVRTIYAVSSPSFDCLYVV